MSDCPHTTVAIMKKMMCLIHLPPLHLHSMFSPMCNIMTLVPWHWKIPPLFSPACWQSEELWDPLPPTFFPDGALLGTLHPHRLVRSLPSLLPFLHNWGFSHLSIMVFRSSGASTLCLSGFKRFGPCPYVMVYGNSLCTLNFRVDSLWYEWFIGYLSLFTIRSSLLTLCNAGDQSAGPISHCGKYAYLLLFQFLHYSVCHLTWLLGPPVPCVLGAKTLPLPHQLFCHHSESSHPSPPPPA